MSKPEKEELRYLIVSTNRQVYNLDIRSIVFVNNGDDGDSVITADFVDKNRECGKMFLSPTFEIKSVQYDIPF